MCVNGAGCQWRLQGIFLWGQTLYIQHFQGAKMPLFSYKLA